MKKLDKSFLYIKNSLQYYRSDPKYKDYFFSE